MATRFGRDSDRLGFAVKGAHISANRNFGCGGADRVGRIAMATGAIAHGRLDMASPDMASDAYL
jgi:hypothetical protein